MPGMRGLLTGGRAERGENNKARSRHYGTRPSLIHKVSCQEEAAYCPHYSDTHFTPLCCLSIRVSFVKRADESKEAHSAAAGGEILVCLHYSSYF
jgi:hypothetical protein